MASARRDKAPRKDTDTMDTATPDCPYCVKNAETLAIDGSIRRQRHYLHLAATEGLEALRIHLVLWLHRWHMEDPDRAREAVHSTLAWVAGEMQQWSGLVDAHTGAPLAWHVARTQAHAARQRLVALSPLAGARPVAPSQDPTPRAALVPEEEPWPEEAPCAYCGEADCEASCTSALVAGVTPSTSWPEPSDEEG